MVHGLVKLVIQTKLLQESFYLFFFQGIGQISNKCVQKLDTLITNWKRLDGKLGSPLEITPKSFTSAFYQPPEICPTFQEKAF